MSAEQDLEIPVETSEQDASVNKESKKDRSERRHSRQSRRRSDDRSDDSDSGSDSRSESESESDDSVVDLCDDRLYQVLSAVLETESGRNVAEILSKMQKDLHILTTSVNQLIQLSLAAQQNSDSGDEAQ